VKICGRDIAVYKFFPILDTCLSREDIAGQSCAMVPDGDFLAIFASCYFSGPRAIRISYMHSQPLVGRSSPYCGNMWKRYCCLTSFFPILDTCLSREDIA